MNDCQSNLFFFTESDVSWMSIETITKCVIVILFVFSTIFLTCLCARRHFASHVPPDTQSLVEFMEGNPQYIQPNVGLGEQACLLPYNERYEFPRNKLELGEQLGSGAFGIVLKAIANGILPNEDKTTVAIKMIKPIHDYEVSSSGLFHVVH